MDVYVSIRKLSVKGEVLEHVNVPWEALPEGVNTQHDVPMAQTVKVCGPWVSIIFLGAINKSISTRDLLAFCELRIAPRTPS